MCNNSYETSTPKLITHQYENGTCTVCGKIDQSYTPPSQTGDNDNPGDSGQTGSDEPSTPEQPEQPGSGGEPSEEPSSDTE